MFVIFAADFVISQEEAIAKGIRRVVALTGLEAAKAVKRAELFEAKVNCIKEDLSKNKVITYQTGLYLPPV